VSNDTLGDLRNLGPQSAKWLGEAGITTCAELRRLGAPLAYHLVKQRQPRASLNLLWALAAGLEDRDWREINAEEKAALRSAVEALLSGSP
jgi:DNA transformation protein